LLSDHRAVDVFVVPCYGKQLHGLLVQNTT
jgi:hypothetical protein